MTPAEYLDAAKAELGIQADNELAKRFEIWYYDKCALSECENR